MSGDLADWTTTAPPEVTGLAGSAQAALFVGTDRIVVRSRPISDGGDSIPPPETVIAMAVPAAGAGD